MAATKSLLLQEKKERDAAGNLETFARYLTDGKPHVFDNFFQAKRLLELADRRFRAGGNESLFDACTQSDKEACWTFKLHPRINAVLNPRGMEMLPIHKDGFVVQTMENCADILLGPKDLYSLCLCLWIVQHRCITKVVLDVSVVARYHSAAFWKILLVSPDRLDSVELRGFLGTPDLFALQPCVYGADRLSELILVDFTISSIVIEQLCELLERNKGLRVLALRNVALDTPVGWLRRLQEGTGSDESDVGESTVSDEGRSESVAALAGSVSDGLSQEYTSVSRASSCSEGCDDQESVDVDTGTADKGISTDSHREVMRDWTPLLSFVKDYVSLTDLEISGLRACMYSSLPELSSVLLANSTLKNLAVQVCLPKRDPVDDWLAFTKAVGQNKGLESLSFAHSTFGSDPGPAVVALRAALEENVSLQKLSMERCGLSGSNTQLLLGCLERNTTLEELHVDPFDDQDFMLKLRDTYKFKGRILFVYESAFGEVRRKTAFEKESAGEMNFTFTRQNELMPMFNALSHARDTVTDLSFDSKDPMTEHGGRLLASILPKCRVLERVSLLFPSGIVSALYMLEAVTQSETVSCLVVGGGWPLTDMVGQSFEHMLRVNTSIRELTIVQPNRTGFEDLKKHLRQGMQKNGLVSKLRLLYDVDRKESRDYEIMRMLQRNRIVEKRLEDMASRVRGDAGCMCCTPNLDVEYYTTRLGLNASNPAYAGLEAQLELSKKLRQEMIDLAGRFSKMLGK